AERRAATLYRRAFDAGDVAPDDPDVEAALARAGSGAPLPAAVRRRMEIELGVSLERVRVHTDPVAAQAARALRAEAFTVGEDIFFAESTYDPESRAGQKLLAHELTHVVQNWQGRSDGGTGRVSQPGESLEQEADAVADRIDQRAAIDERRIDRRSDRDRGDPARPAEGRPTKKRDADDPPPPIKPAPTARATGSRMLQRKVTDRPRTQTNEPGIIPPTFRRLTQRIPGPGKPATNGRALFASQLDRVRDQTKSTFAPLKTTVKDAKKTPVGAKSKEHGKADRKKHHEHQRDAHAQADRHRAQAAAHKNAKHAAPAPAPTHETEDPPSPIQFKKITDWNKFLPPPMPDTDERERAHLLKLIKEKIGGERAESQKALGQ